MKYMAIFATLLFFSCQKDDKMQAMAADEVVPSVMNAHSDIVIDEATLANEVTFSWSAVDYGYPAAISYKLYAVYGESEPYQIGESYSTSYTLTKEGLNNALVNTKGLAVPEDATSLLFFYVTSGISTGKSYITQSEPISLNVTTIKSTAAAWIRRPLYVAGNYQGWNPAKAPVLWENGMNSDVYEGLVFLGSAAGTPNHNDDNLCHFKFCPNPNWTGNLGGDPNALTNEGDPAHITAAEGLYWITVTLNAEHTAGKVALLPVAKLGVVGAAVGSWDNDLVMSLVGMPTDPSAEGYADKYYAAIGAQTWEAVCENAVVDTFKFRLNGTWLYSWGGTLDHLIFNDQNNVPCELTGRVRFTINFKGDIAALAGDETNPSPISGTITNVE